MKLGTRFVIGLAVAAIGVSGASADAFVPVGVEPEAIQPLGTKPEPLVLNLWSAPHDVAQRLTPGQRRATIIGDSAMAGVRWNHALGGLRGFYADHRLESCRRLVSPSCRGREGRIPLTVLSEVNLLPYAAPTDVLVIATGYNDWHVGFDWQSRMILDAARSKGYQTVAWVTYRENNTYELPGGDVRSNYVYMNDELDRIVASGAYPELQLWDLNQYTVGAAAWFKSDGVHQLWIGSWGVADWISRHMAALDGRPCVLPWNLGIGQEQPCPDPDPLPPARGYPDLRTIYDF